MTEENVKFGVQLAGMKCWKCNKEIGALCIPFDQQHTPESLAAYLVANKILPVCEPCIKANPKFVRYENLER